MLSNYFTTPFTIKTLHEEVDAKKILRKTYTAQPETMGAFVIMSQGKTFQNDKDTVISSNLIYCAPSEVVAIKDHVVCKGVEYGVVSVLPDLKGHHKEIYLVQI